jgi:hypothetical protein
MSGLPDVPAPAPHCSMVLSDPSTVANLEPARSCPPGITPTPRAHRGGTRRVIRSVSRSSRCCRDAIDVTRLRKPSTIWPCYPVQSRFPGWDPGRDESHAIRTSRPRDPLGRLRRPSPIRRPPNLFGKIGQHFQLCRVGRQSLASELGPQLHLRRQAPFPINNAPTPVQLGGTHDLSCCVNRDFSADLTRTPWSDIRWPPYTSFTEGPVSNCEPKRHSIRCCSRLTYVVSPCFENHLRGWNAGINRDRWLCDGD